MTDAIKSHAYLLGETKVLALDDGPLPRVMEVCEDEPWWQPKPFVVRAEMLEPLPLRYLHGGMAG